jgi:TolB-like protein
MNVGQRLLTREGDAISLPPKATDILLLLLQNAGELVEKDDLMKEVWPDSFVEEGNLTQNIFTLRRALGDNRSNARFIETVTGRGYRLIAPVTVLDSQQPVSEVGVAQLGPPPILAVLPFVNATANHDLEYLADGVTDNIINNLSQISKLRVIPRVAVFRYKGREIDPKTFAEELGVDAMLLGKIISRPTGLMINVELVDASNGWQLWGEKYDCELNDILEIQDKIARQIPATLRLS